MFVFLLAGLQLLLKPGGAPSRPVCPGLTLRQEAGAQPHTSVLFQPESAAQQPPSGSHMNAVVRSAGNRNTSGSVWSRQGQRQAAEILALKVWSVRLTPAAHTCSTRAFVATHSRPCLEGGGSDICQELSEPPLAPK